MQRRDFIKYMSLFSACACAGCNMQTNKREDDDEKYVYNDLGGGYDFRNGLWKIGFPICHHCNVNCASCNHFAPLAKKYEMPAETFKHDIEQLHRISKGRIAELRLHGGEPLLHPQIEKFIAILGEYFPYSKKTIKTNGLLLTKMPQSFWDICAKEKVKIVVSIYPAFRDYYDSVEYLKLQNKFPNVQILNIPMDKFKNIDLDKNVSLEDDNNWSNCDRKIRTTQISEGRLYNCFVMDNIKTFNETFAKYAIELPQDHYLELDKVSTIEEIVDFYNKPKEFCKHCHYCTKKPEADWKLSKKELSEWYRV